MRVATLTREYPPHVYGGAGVHVDFLTRELRTLVDVDVHCLGEPRPGATAHAEVDPRLTGANPVLGIFAADLEMAAAVAGCDLVHSHTWYANLAGHVAKLLHGIPHVVTSHSLEPQRPWKAEQLAGGYRLSSWAEATAYAAADAIVAVSAGSKQDILHSYPSLPPERIHVVHNGIDTDFYHPVTESSVVTGLGIDPDRPAVVFVGRITRQKGVAHLLRAARQFDPRAQVVLLAGAADTPELATETATAIEGLRAERDGVVWVSDMLPRTSIREVLSHADVFVCPSIYEPLGIVNLEAMACATAVVASDVGGIPEVVDDGRTGWLVHYDGADPDGFEAALAAAVNQLVAAPEQAALMGAAGRERAIRQFSWATAARRTVAIYRALLAGHPPEPLAERAAPAPGTMTEPR